ncbi:replication protein [Enterobacter hormaechei]|uniref:replication protein n=1 Tax=Enterobacter hormaechei TaxID=158836 RepID=UPI0007948FC0|nr:replication protein [Enterobacter hormaechei]ELD3395064.1 replication protein [Enterobacter hormaechei]ELD4125709.1 replication protein [Enterobacter hormaechei]EMB5587890.1 replication protein [Enterobacter hormaechei]MBK4421785.1 replication protein [Enterobacter hormaechei]MCC2017922.1 replication protein [Enterobacter hormaechei]
MENQKTGFIPLYRSVLKQTWSKDVFLRTLWENLLLCAARQPYTANFKGRQWPLQTGQLVTTSADLGLNLCDREGKPCSRHAVDRMLDVFEREGMISRSGEKRKGSVITITNYAEYAQKMDDLPERITAHISALNAEHGESSNGAASEGYAAHNGAHLPERFTENHEQQCNNNNKNIKRSSSENSDESSDARLKKFLSAHPEAAVYTPSGAKWGSAEDLEIAKWISSRVKLINPTCKAPDMTSWSNTVRLMRQIDNRSHQDICALYDWASKHHFWQTNILSPESLRKQWDKLTMQRNSGGEQRAAKPDLDFNNTDWAYEVIR